MQFGKDVLHYDIIDSTNNEAKRICESGVVHGRLIMADCQSAGRGRRGRNWLSADNGGIYMSYILKPLMKPIEASMLTLVAAMATAKAINEVTGLEIGIKWPNDIVYNGKKISGILTEMLSDGDCIQYVIVGIGINVNTGKFSEELSNIATSLYLETSKITEKSDIVNRINIYMEEYYDVFCRTCDMISLKKQYEDMLVNLGRPVYADDGNSVIQYTAVGINRQGELVVKDTDGIIKNIRAGEVSVRGIYGYV